MGNNFKYLLCVMIVMSINATNRVANFVFEHPACLAKGFGGMSISQDLFNYILNHLEKGKTILELGSGWATGELVKHYTVYSIEHDQQWLHKYGSHYIFAPIKNGWYDIEVLKKELPILHYDLILVDGPPGIIGRKGFSENLSLFETNNIPIIFDDTNRKADFENMKQTAELLNRNYEVFKGKSKNFGVILP